MRTPISRCTAPNHTNETIIRLMILPTFLQRLTATVNNSGSLSTAAAGNTNNDPPNNNNTENVPPAAAAASQRSTTALNPQTSDVFSDLSESLLQATDARSKAATVRSCGTRNGGKHFKEAEILLLAKAWCHVSTDAQVGTNQTSERMWIRVHEQYTHLRTLAVMHDHEDLPERDAKSLESFWYNSLLKAANKYTAICKQHPMKSGENDQVKYDQRMLVLYQQQVKNSSGYPKNFGRFLRAHKFLKMQPKWNDSNTPASATVGNDQELAQGKKRDRPPGRDTSKLDSKVNKAAKRALEERSSEDERWRASMCGNLKTLTETYVTIERDFTMAHAPEELRNEYFRARAERLLLEESARKKAAEICEQNLDSTVEVESLNDVEIVVPTVAADTGGGGVSESKNDYDDELRNDNDDGGSQGAIKDDGMYDAEGSRIQIYSPQNAEATVV